jgi:cystathionine gamma-synthase
MHFETKAIHAGGDTDESTGAVAPPIHLSTTFERGVDGTPAHEYSYIREHSPTQTRAEAAIAAIEGAEASLVFASGMAAGAAIVESLKAGDHVLLERDSYYTYRLLAAEYFAKWQLRFDLADMSDPAEVKSKVQKETRVIWSESPSNPLLSIADLRQLADLAHSNNAMLVVDNTFASPALQRPIELGADLVLEATTKYLGGHSDVAGGCLAFARRDGFFGSVSETRTVLGGIASPFNSWLVLRGIRSLAVRMRVHSSNALVIAQFLATHPRVEVVHYPGLESHPGHEIAAKQMSAFGGMLSFRVRGEGRQEAIAVVSRARLFTRATSLGGVESLIEHRASSEGPTSTTPQNLIRLSVGLEHPDDLIEDLEQALSSRQ